MDKEAIKQWIKVSLVMQDEAREITGQSLSGFNQSVATGRLLPFAEFGDVRKTRLYLREDLEQYGKNKRIRKGANTLNTIEELQVAVTDERVRLFESEGVYYAVVVEENGDEFDLARSKNLDDLHQQLKDAGVAE